MVRNLCVILSAVLLVACSDKRDDIASPYPVFGKWITEASGQAMLDPQTSGLVVWKGELLTLSDGSAHESQRLQLHKLRKSAAHVLPDSLTMVMSDRVKESCFAPYLLTEPDLEAVAVDASNPHVFYVVTEDASRAENIDAPCLQNFRNTGSTDYPSLLLRLELQSDRHVIMSHVRPLQFPEAYQVGNFPNDGIEGLAMAPNGMLYLGLEKDSKGQPRIFTVDSKAIDWQSDAFLVVSDPQLKLPHFERGNHPINGMDYIQTENGNEWLVAAARNDDELWLIDLNAKLQTLRVKLSMFAPSGDNATSCDEFIEMDNASLEGVAVDENEIWLINDPWKKNYQKNIKCESNRENYERNAPLLFKLDRDIIERLVSK